MTWEQLYDIAIGDLGFSQQQMLTMSLNEILIMKFGQVRKIETELKQTRLIMWAIFQKNNKKRIKPESILKLQSEQQQSPTRILTKEEYAQLNKMWSN